MFNRKMSNKKDKGITIIVLVITIIVLLVLAGIPIATLRNKNGIINKTQESANAIVNDQQEESNMIKEYADTLSKNQQIRFSIKPHEWTNEEVNITASAVNKDYKVQIRKDGGKWEDADSSNPIKIDQNGQKIEARLVYEDSSGNKQPVSEDISSIKIQNIDKTFPSNTAPTFVTSADTIVVTNRQEDNESGINESETRYYIKKSSDPDTEWKEQKSGTFTGLTASTEYVVKTKVTDNAGNTTESSTTTVSTTAKEEIDLSNEITLASSSDDWTNKDVIVTATTNVTKYTLQTSQDDNTWTSATKGSDSQTATETVKTNGQWVYARLLDGENVVGKAKIQVTKIDKQAPTNTAPEAKTAAPTSSKIVVTLKQTDPVATSTNGQSGLKTSETKYYIKKSSDADSTYKEQTSGTFTGLTASTSYTVKTKVTDNAGNTTESSTTTVSTTAMPTVSSDGSTAVLKLTPSTTEWTNGDITVTASSTAGTGYTIQTSTDNKTWGTTNPLTFTGNGTAYARLTDGTNITDVATLAITKIDKLAPTNTAPEAKTAAPTSSKIIVTLKQTDPVATSTNGQSGLKTSETRYYLKKTSDADSAYKEQTSGTFTGLTASTSYTVKTKVTDNAGNTTESSTTTVSTTAMPTVSSDGSTAVLKLTPSTTEWTNGDITVTASSTAGTGYTIQTSTDNKTWGTTNPLTFTGNGTAYARLTDGTNITDVATLAITKIDKLAPTFTSAEIKNITATGYDVYVYGVSDGTGSGVNRVAFPTWTSNNGQDDIQSNWEATGSTAVGEDKGSGTWYYRVNTTDHKNEAGTYITQIYFYDNVGNSSSYTTLTQPTVPTVTATFDANGGTTPSTTSITKAYNNVLGTLPTSTRTGFDFIGWFTDKTGGTQINSTTTIPASDVTYYAHWQGTEAMILSGSAFQTKVKEIQNNVNSSDLIDCILIESLTWSTTQPDSKYLTDDYAISVNTDDYPARVYLYPGTNKKTFYLRDSTAYITSTESISKEEYDKATSSNGFYTYSNYRTLQLYTDYYMYTTSTKTYLNTKCNLMFGKFSSLASLDLSDFDTSKVTDMSSMFENCSNLTNLNVSNFNTSKVTDMRGTFSGCSSLTSLKLDSFDTSSVVGMETMFLGCSKLTNLDVNNFNTSSVTNMRAMFQSCSSLTSLDLKSFNTSKVTDMSSMFYYCSSLTSLDVSNFNTSSITNMSAMFDYCSSLTSLDVSNFDTSSVTDMTWMFSCCKSLTSLDVSNFNTSSVTVMNGMFSSCQNLTSLGVSNFDTSKVTDISSMFDYCSSLTSLDVSNFNTSSITNMNRMFSNCQNLTNLNVSSFDTSNVTNMTWMFGSCSSLTSLDISAFNTSSVTNMDYMFSVSSKLTTVYVSNHWTTSAVTSSEKMFYNSTSINGGAGTTYDSNHIDKAYAHIDGGTSNPGYFTYKPAVAIPKLTLSASPSTWTSGSVTVTASTTETGYTIQTSTDGITWGTTNPLVFIEGGTAYARLYDGTDYGDTTSLAVNNIDLTNPTTTAPTYAQTVSITSSAITSSITVTNNQTDSESGVETYQFSINDGDYVTETSNTHTFTGLSLSTTYKIKTKAIDKLGHSSETGNTSVTTLQIGDTVTYTPAGTTATVSGTDSGTGSDQTLTASNIATKFKVWKIDKTKNEIQLVIESNPSIELGLKGAAGYNNAVQILNNACSKLYSNSEKGITARSFDAKDIEDAMIENGTDISKVAKDVTSSIIDSPLQYGQKNDGGIDPRDSAKTNPSKYTSSTYVPSIYGTYTSTDDVDISSKQDSDLRSEVKTDGSDYITGTASAKAKSLTVKQTYYYLSHNQIWQQIGTTRGNILGSRSCWLASRCVNAYSRYAYFYVRNLDGGSFDHYGLYYSRDYSDSKSLALCPSVFLGTTVQLKSPDTNTNSWMVQ